MRGKQIVYADIHRDGGSDSFIFEADDSRQYESFIKSRALDIRPDSPFYPPVISLDSVNSREVVQPPGSRPNNSWQGRPFPIRDFSSWFTSSVGKANNRCGSRLNLPGWPGRHER